MSLEEKVLDSITRLRSNMDEVAQSLADCQEEDSRNLILATGGLSIIYANTVQLLALDALYKCLTSGSRNNPLIAVKEEFNNMIDDAIQKTNHNYSGEIQDRIQI